MADLFGSMRSAGASLRALTDALGVVQGNISNESTPGYARRRVVLTEATPSSTGLESGGVQSLGAETTRVQTLESSVWQNSGEMGRSTQLQLGLEALVNTLEPGAAGGVSDSVKSLLTSFQALSSKPADDASRQQVLAAAQNVAAAINQTATLVESYQANYENQLQGTINKVNQLVSQIANADKAAREAGSESLADTRVYGALEELSKLIDFKVLHGSDGSLTLLGGGQVPLVQGGKAFPLSVEPSISGTDRPLPQVVDAFGKNVSSTFRSGEVAGLVELTNKVLPSMIGGGGATGVLNDLAKELGTAVNGALSPGNPIFTWSPGAGPNAASTLAVVSGFQTSDLPTTGTPLANLSALRSSSLPALGGKTLQTFMDGQVQKLAYDATGAAGDAATSKSLFNQALNVRSQASGVSLEQEAVELLQIQHTFQAVSRLIATLNDMFDSVLAMKR